MKKIFTFTLACLLALGSQAQTEVELTADNFIVTSVENHEAALGPVTLPTDRVTRRLIIPESVEIDGESYTVTSIQGPVVGSNRAFIDSIGVPATVRTIGAKAFKDIMSTASSFYTYTFTVGFAEGSELTEIGDSAFQSSHIKSITLPERLKHIGKSAFDGTQIAAFTLPESVQEMGTAVFANCSSLREMHWNSTLDAIPDSTFFVANVSSWALNAMDLNNIKHIGTAAFMNSSVTILAGGQGEAGQLPEGLLTIGDRAFYGVTCTASEKNPLVLPTTLQSIGSEAFQLRNSTYFYTEASVPATMGENALYGKLSIPLEHFGTYAAAPVWQDMALYNMPSINDAEGNTYDILGFHSVQLTAFAQPQTVYFGYDDTMTYGDFTFSITGYTSSAVAQTEELHLGPLCEALPNGDYTSVRSIFLSENFKNMANANLPAYAEIHPLSAEPPALTIEKPYWRVFLSDSQLEAYGAHSKWSASIPNPFEVDGLILSQGWQPEGSNAIVRDTRDGDLVLPADVTYEGTTYHIASVKHINEEVTAVTVTAPWTAIDDYQFANLAKMTRITLPQTLQTIGQFAFAGSAIESLELPASVRSIGQEAFRSCNKLRQLNLPEGIDTLRFFTFAGSAIEELHLPASLTVIEQLALSSSMLNNITVAEGNTAFKAINGVLFSKDEKTLLHLPAGPQRRTYDIPYGTEKIAHTALRTANLRALRVPATVKGFTRLPYGAGNMERYNLIGNGCVVYADLTQQEVIDSLISPGGTPRILFIPSSWRDEAILERYGYDYEKAEEQIDIVEAAKKKYTSVQYEDEDLGFTYSFDTGDYGMPKGFYIDGITARKVSNIVLPETLTAKITAYPYYGEEYTFPVVGISKGAFAFCTMPRSVTVPSSLQYIGEAAFFGCTRLREVNGLDTAKLDTVYTYKRGASNYNVTTGIEGFAFAECKGLTSLKARVSQGDPRIVVGCDNMKELVLETPASNRYYEVDGIYYSHSATDGNSLCYYPAGRYDTELTVADSINGISSYAFIASRLERVTLPASVQNIDNAAFYKSYRLKELVLTTNDPDSIPYFVTNEGSGYISYNNYLRKAPGYGVPYKFTNMNQRMVEQFTHPSFDADYTRENTVVKMTPQAMQKLAEYERDGWPEHTKFGETTTNRSRYEALLATFKAIEEDTTVGIDTVVTVSNAPVKAIYSLSGQRISHPRRGLNIINGRKVMLK